MHVVIYYGALEGPESNALCIRLAKELDCRVYLQYDRHQLVDNPSDIR
jgi:hypothetical protein